MNGETPKFLYEQLEPKDDFDNDAVLHHLEQPVAENQIVPGVEQKDFKKNSLLITEFSANDAENRGYQDFVKLQQFYSLMRETLREYLPPIRFAIEPSTADPEKVSLFVIQQFERDEKAKEISDLNSAEFDTDVMDKLLDLEERLSLFLENYEGDIPSQFIDVNAFDPKKIPGSVVYSKELGLRLVNLFRFNAEQSKSALGSDKNYEPAAVDELKGLKAIGLYGMAEKIQWVLDKSAAPEWIRGKDVHWKLDSQKLDAQGLRGMALTFDDGPNEETEKLLDILKAEDTKATFFLIGSQIKGHEDTVRRIVAEGHDVGVHEWGQEGARISDPKEWVKRFIGPRNDFTDVTECAKLIEKTTGMKPSVGRVSGVHGTLPSLREFQSNKLQIIHANPYDIAFMVPSETLHANTLLKRAISGNGQGRIRLFHIGKMEDGGYAMKREDVDYAKGEVYPPDATLGMIKEYIQRSKEEGYSFVQVKDYI